MKYADLANQILKGVGGKENIVSVTHCATRLRFNLKNDNVANKDEITSLQGVISVINKGGQFQVIIGNTVKDVYKELIKLVDLESLESSDNSCDEDKGIITKVLDTISGIFVPIVPALAGAGMLKAVLSLLTAINAITTDSQVYQILNFMGDAAFYFLPVILAASSAKKFKCNQYLAMVVGGILLHPTLTSMISIAKESGTGLHILGLPVGLVNYSSSVIPIILAVWFMSYVESFCDKVVPKSIKLFMTPLCTIFIVGIVTLVAIGPLGDILGVGLGIIIEFLNAHVSWLVPTLVGAFTPLMVMVGMHYGLIPIGINMLASSGIDTVAGPGMMVSNIAQGGAVLAVAIRAKSKEIKSLATSTGITCVCGITEPAMYGVSLRFKKPLIATIIGGGAGGLFLGIMSVGRYAQVSPGLFALPSFIGPDGFSNLIYACTGAGISFVVAFGVSLVFGIDEVKEEVSKETINDNKESDDLNKKPENKDDLVKDKGVIYAPIKGKTIPLQKVNDEVFSSEALGKGIAIIPDEGRVYSPVEGIISTFFETRHAIGIVGDNGIEVLIHVGLDTVQMQGRNFVAKKNQGDRVKKGDLLLEFDKEAIRKEGYEITTPVIITNSFNYNDFNCELDKDIEIGEVLMEING